MRLRLAEARAGLSTLLEADPRIRHRLLATAILLLLIVFLVYFNTRQGLPDTGSVNSRLILFVAINIATNDTCLNSFCPSSSEYSCWVLTLRDLHLFAVLCNAHNIMELLHVRLHIWSKLLIFFHAHVTGIFCTPSPSLTTASVMKYYVSDPISALLVADLMKNGVIVIWWN